MVVVVVEHQGVAAMLTGMKAIVAVAQVSVVEVVEIVMAIEEVAL
jgi:hypothetical protein